ncbi:MAG TPA: peptidyl-prolyl cis-trans isomerase [Allosphingosinicella sp.]|jgi:peptidyl-prolyl cis-trans isomerase D
MLSIFRRGIVSKLMLVVLAIGLFAIVITGFGTGGGGLGDVAGGGGGDTIAKVEGEKITATRVQDETQRQLDRMRQQQPELDLATFLRGGALGEVIDQLIDITASVVFGREQGLGVYRQMVDREIAGISAFQNMAGQFDDATFRRVLQQEKLTEQQLREEIETRLIQRQLVLPAAGSAYVPTGLAFQYASLLLESRTAIVGAVPTGAVGMGQEPSEAEIAAFYRSNQPRYTIPERRVLRYAAFGPEQVAAAAKATDAEIQAAYNQNPAYAAKESRTLSQVILPDQAAAQALARKVAAGTSFAQAAQQAGFAPADTAIGSQTREAFTKVSSSEVAAAAFGAAKGATVGPVRSPLGWHVVRVDDVKSGAATPLASVRAQLAAQIEQRKAQNAVNDLAARIEERLADGASFEDIVRAEKLSVRETPPVTAAGAAPGVAGWQPPAELRPLLEGGFAMEPGDDPAVETIEPNRSYALLAVTRTIPAAAPPLAQLRGQVRADLIARRASERARAIATSIVAKINAGVPAAQAFAQAQVKLPATQTITAVRRDIARQGGQVPPPMAMMFSLPRGKARILPAPNNSGWIVVYLDRVAPGDARKEPALTESVKSQFAQIMGDEYAQQFMAAVRSGLDIERNDEALRKLRTSMMGAAPAQ